jgi:hypothetical protein
MFTVEIRINGSLIGHIYGHNEGENNGITKYSYEYYRPDSNKLVCGETFHKREAGIEKLIELILRDYQIQFKKLQKKHVKIKRR